mmetsp:Transcript_14245/g.21082  ORF Transcript_14245/g.21082 Transcript_14245/m.21082 type:complete len:132 (+) Transcript_14245:47-442(+)
MSGVVMLYVHVVLILGLKSVQGKASTTTSTASDYDANDLWGNNAPLIFLGMIGGMALICCVLPYLCFLIWKFFQSPLFNNFVRVTIGKRMCSCFRRKEKSPKDNVIYDSSTTARNSVLTEPTDESDHIDEP